MKTKLILSVVVIGLVTLAFYTLQNKKKDNHLIQPQPTQQTSQNVDEKLLPKEDEKPIDTQEIDPPAISEIANQPQGVIPLSIDGLLDDLDKTDENKLKVANHFNLLLLTNEFRSLRKTTREAPTVEQLTRWVQTLIVDAFVKYQLEQGLVPQEDLTDLQSIQLGLIPNSEIDSRHFSSEYLTVLTSLAEQTMMLKNEAATENTLQSISARVYDLAKRRKEQSEVFYLGMMHKYFPNYEYTMSQKVNFSQQFVDAGDLHLAKYTLEFFQDSVNLPEHKNDQVKIQEFIKTTTQELQNQ